MSKVLILSRDPLPEEGDIATGGGLRSLSIMKGLEKKGHDVAIAYPEKVLRILPELKKENKNYSYSSANIDTIINEVSPDVLIQECIGDVEHLKAADIPIVFDVPGPKLLEISYLNTSLEKDIENKIESFAMGDYFLFSNERQKIYSLPWLILAGVNVNENIAGIVPYSTSPDLPKRNKENPIFEPIFVWGGIFWPWQNSGTTLNTVLETIDKKKSGYLKVIGGTFPFGYSKINKFSNFVPDLKKSDRLWCYDLLPYNKMLDLYTECSVAVDLADNSCERELSSPFRTIDYLSCGLPVLINKSIGMSELIVKYRAGWAINPDDRGELNKILKVILENPEMIREYSKNAQKLVSEHFVWGNKIEDLDRFCRNPIKRKKIKPVFENIIQFNLGKRLRLKGYHNEAIEEFLKLNRQNENKEWVHFELGITFKEAKNYDKALYELAFEDKLFPDKTSVKTETGNIYLLQKKYDQAKNEFKKSLKIDPHWPFTHYSMGCVFMEEEKFEDALTHFKLTGPNFLFKDWVDYYSGFSHMKIGNDCRAIVNFEKNSDTFPFRIYSLYYLGSIYKRTKNLKESKKYFSTILEGDIDLTLIDKGVSKDLISGTHFHLGEIYKIFKKYDEAINEFNACLKLNPDHRKAKKYLNEIN